MISNKHVSNIESFPDIISLFDLRMAYHITIAIKCFKESSSTLIYSTREILTPQYFSFTLFKFKLNFIEISPNTAFQPICILFLITFLFLLLGKLLLIHYKVSKSYVLFDHLNFVSATCIFLISDQYGFW